MKKLLLILPLFILFGFKPDNGKFTGVVNTIIEYTWTDTVYLDVTLVNTGEEKRIYFINEGQGIPKLNDKVIFEYSQIINIKNK
jgi:hypothetical protein